MSNIHTPATPELWNYIRDVSLREADVLRRIREATANHPQVSCQIAAEQGQFMALLIRLMGAKRTLEIGVFTGYSSTAVALALPEDGRIIACDRSEAWTSVASRFWREAGVEHEVVTYEGAPHSFFDRKQENFAEASAGAWQKTLDFIERHRT